MAHINSPTGDIYRASTEYFSIFEYFVNIFEKFATLKMCLYWAASLYSYSYCSKAPNTRVKYPWPIRPPVFLEPVQPRMNYHKWGGVNGELFLACYFKASYFYAN